MKPTIEMTTSPYDRSPASVSPTESSFVQLGCRSKQRWIPSRFNSRTIGDDGELIMWNSFSGAISSFAPVHREDVLAHLSQDGLTSPLDKTGEYLSKRGFLVRDDVSELNQFRYRYGREQWRSDVLQLHLLASEDCNFRCVYCYEKFKHGTMLPDVREGVRACVLERAPHLKRLDISWFGGEPLYGWEAIEDLAPFFKDVAERYGMAHTQHMTTNAYLLSEERAAKLLQWGCTDFQITIDGLPEQHDCKRVGRDGSPTYQVILNNLRALQSRQDMFSVTIRVNFDRENAPHLARFLEALSADFGGDPRFQLRFRSVGKWGGDNDENLDTCGTGEQRQVLSQLEATADKVGLQVEGGIHRAARFGSHVCYAARPYNFIVGATGKLMKCTIALDDMEENIVGQLHRDGTMDISDERMSQWVNPYFESDSMCQHCHLLPSCQGAACPLVRIRHNRRSCCSTKSSLKHDMRFTLAKAKEARLAGVAASAHADGGTS